MQYMVKIIYAGYLMNTYVCVHIHISIHTFIKYNLEKI